MSELDSRRGVKRKRGERVMKVVELDKKLPSKLHHGIKEAVKAAKKARTFETQKLVKRLKQLRTKESEKDAIEDAEDQLEALKHLNVDVLAQVALRTKINKDRTLSGNEHMTAALAKELPSAINWDSAAPGTSTAKVQARVLSSKHLAIEVSHIVEALRSIIQPSDKPRDATESTYPMPISDSAVEMKMKEPSRPTKTRVSGAEDPHEQPSDEAEPNEELGDDDGWESGTVGGDEDDTNDVLDSDVQDADHGSDTDGSPAEDSHLSDQPPKRKVPRPAGKQTVDTNASAFLPSLSVGYIRGDSDTDSDTGATDVQPKKNRRGQRARRAIWEKKYGKNANHKKKEMQSDTRSPRNVKLSHPSRTAPPKNKVKFSGPSHDAGKTVLPNRTVSHDQQSNRPLHQPQTSDTRPLHPSWEAKRKAKEKANAGIVPSQGKKIVFS